MQPTSKTWRWLAVAALVLFVASGIFALGMKRLGDQPANAAFVSCEGHLTIGTELFMGDTRAYLGKVLAVEDKHRFGDDTARPAVQIEFPDGKLLWVPKEACRKLYLVKNGHGHTGN